MSRRSRRDQVYDALAQAAPDLAPTVLWQQTDTVMRQVVVLLAAERDTALTELFRLRKTIESEDQR